MTETTIGSSNAGIVAALACADRIREDLLAMSVTREASGMVREIRAFEDALNSGMGADDFRKDGNLVRWLPAILDFEQTAGDRNERLRRLAGALARTSPNVWPVRSYTWSYLSILGFLVVSLFLFLSSTVLPVFDTMFKEFQLKLPAMTRVVLWVGSWIGPNSLTIFFAIIASLFMFRLGNRLMRRLSHDRIFVTYWQRLCFGSSEGLIGMSRFTYALACLLRINIELPEAILIAGRACENAVCLRNAIRLSTEIKTQPANHCPAARFFPPLMIEALRDDGIANGNKRVAIEIIRELSRIYSDRVKHRHELVAEFLLPIAMVLLGLVVGVIVLSLFMPLVSLITSLS
ncbi:MAG: hypothetical protein ABL921_26805 [Pirellula sp.]